MFSTLSRHFANRERIDFVEGLRNCMAFRSVYGLSASGSYGDGESRIAACGMEIKQSKSETSGDGLLPRALGAMPAFVPTHCSTFSEMSRMLFCGKMAIAVIRTEP